jgi:hypothetical protein
VTLQAGDTNVVSEELSLLKEVQLFIVNQQFLSRRKVELLASEGFFQKAQELNG